MPQYIVISDGLLSGTISDHPSFVTRAWLAILFDAEKLKGRTYMPVRVLAKRASITNEEAIQALQILQDPDPLSSSKAHDGRRLLPVAGEEGWYVLATWEEHAKQREVFFHRLRQQRHQKKKAEMKLADWKDE